MRIWTSSILLTLALLSWGCQSVYYDTMERMGIHKRDILVDRVEEAQESQEEAKEQFADALEAFQATVTVDGGELQETYEKLKLQYDYSVRSANDVRGRITAVKGVAEALFDEWESELDQYTNESFRRTSEQQLRSTQKDYEKLVKAMENAESKMSPVLTVFSDQVLFLKHNLNARAIASIRNEVLDLEDDVANLIEEMNQAIAEAEAFINQLQAEE